MTQHDLTAFSAYQQQMRQLIDAANASLEPLRAVIGEAEKAASALAEPLNKEKSHVEIH